MIGFSEYWNDVRRILGPSDMMGRSGMARPQSLLDDELPSSVVITFTDTIF